MAGVERESHMKLKFKVQPYQTHAVDSRADCFAGPPSPHLRATEKSKIACARKFFAKITSDQVKYDVVEMGN